MNPFFGYDIRNIFILYEIKNEDNILIKDYWINDNKYLEDIKNGFTIKKDGNNIYIKGTDSFDNKTIDNVLISKFYYFIYNLKLQLKNNCSSGIHREFESIKVAFPYTIINYKYENSNPSRSRNPSRGRNNNISVF